MGLVLGDRPPSKWRVPSAWLVNLDRSDSGRGGTHWASLLVILIGRQKMGLYFDPAGLPPPTRLHKSAERAGVFLVYTDSAHQREGNDCGRRASLGLVALANRNPAEALEYYEKVLAAD